jgi:hypothetical protein
MRLAQHPVSVLERKGSTVGSSKPEGALDDHAHGRSGIEARQTQKSSRRLEILIAVAACSSDRWDTCRRQGDPVERVMNDFAQSFVVYKVCG